MRFHIDLSNPGRRLRHLLGAGIAATLLLTSACGGDDTAAGTTDEPAPVETPTTDAPTTDAPTTDAPTTGNGGASAGSGELLTGADLGEGFELWAEEPLFTTESFCEGDAPPSPTVVDADASSWATDDLEVIVGSERITTAGTAADFAGWILGELERCNEAGETAYEVDQIGDATWSITSIVDFGEGPQAFSTSWMALSSPDVIAAVHLIDGGLSDLDGLALLAQVAG